MYLNKALVGRLNQSDKINEWQEQLVKESAQLITGLAGSAKSLTISTLLAKKKKILVVTPNLYYANKLVDDLQHIIEEKYLHFFPVDEVTAVEMSFSSPEALSDRINALNFLASNNPGILVTPLAGLRRFLPNPKVWKEQTIILEKEGTVDLTKLPESLVLLGYERQQMIGKPGEFSVRGSIIDIYPLTSDYPVRIDLFDDEIESLRLFDADTQRSIKEIDQIMISPAMDTPITKEQLVLGAEKIQKLMETKLSLMAPSEEKEQVAAYFESIISEWSQGHPTDEVKIYGDLLFDKKHYLTNYLKPSDFIMIDDYSRMVESEREILREEGEWITLKLEEGVFFEDHTLGGDFRSILKEAKQGKTYFSLFQKGMGNLRFSAIHPFEYRTMQQFFGQMPLLKTEMDRWKKQNQSVIVLAENEERTQKVEALLMDFEIPAVVNNSEKLIPGEIQIQTGSLASGFELPEEKLVVLVEKEILHTQTKKRARKQTISNAERLKSYNELKPGDYVVHANHGIGKYIGMETLLSGGIHQDYMTILYKNNDKLFIPVTQLDLIQKYVASESKTPRVNKLGGSEWVKTKNKVSAKVEDIADDLIQLYAEREAQKGYAFGPDDDYQMEFEGNFPYTETDDQLRSIQEIKQDMEKERPMDRLLVGDVGYGKTEVAIRAAFKAVRDGKQVAILVPTTILAQQHYETMRDRFANFPVNVGLMSRFRTKKQQNETADKLKKGQIDIVVGTHRILSKDVEFMDIGLVVVDEEQRFGVKHKERLKQLKSQVDVLTLTATPIPRTLHMSMLGVRDLSVIETPPANRYPVQTYVMEKNPGAIREACEREIARGGQIFYLYNRVDTIEQKVDELRAMLPDARISYAHGQMTEVQLENVLMEFINGDYDILVTTTIIETGVDIPNVNTLFVENADYMGLSQLYQLRGRVGRSNRVAYSYFMYEPQKVLNEVSEKRLQAIKDFTELGSGFKIAMRDLSIRGAGNLLGAQQHGFIDSVGFDMYTQMLTEAVNRKQGMESKDTKTVTELDLGIDAYIPTDYIEDERQKIEIYKRIRQLDNQEMFDELEADLLDRFGEYPDEVANLLTVGLIKMNSEFALVEKIKKEQLTVHVCLSKEGTNAYNIEQVFKALSATTLKAELNSDDKLVIQLKLVKQTSKVFWLQELSQFIAALREEKYVKKEQKDNK
ncbi:MULTISPECIES: transcription-repair coupling factor [Vagococcus]|uniref:Transcription-repair-coupling factor n=1 Tax=Vagococcus fluvialis bH819 TaxID=1255619 RepID=A0A1X6WNY9_9ENTE|nr:MULTISPECIES: transcription-repair coupling factor [Vagococcus]SLM86051.1 Transcription-repair coupling factor [Vagococcus fluvialis bH819]HCM88819.1 transcription-repair coupling factor [Vagococcus sp.]